MDEKEIKKLMGIYQQKGGGFGHVKFMSRPTTELIPKAEVS